jgi:capsular polysaccharide biosynthesis protein
VELEAEGRAPNRSWSPVVPVPAETVAVAVFQWKRLPLSRSIVLRYLAYAMLIVVVCTVLAYSIAASAPAQYGARSEINYPVSAQIASGGFLRSDLTLQTQLVTLKSRQILTPIAAKYHMSTDELLTKLKAGVLSASQVIQIEVDDHSPARAKTLVGEIATAYLKQIPNPALDAETSLNKSIAAVDANIRTTQNQLNALIAQNPGGTPTTAESTLQNQLVILANQRTDLQSKLSDATVTDLQTPHVTQLTQPYLLNGKVAPKPLKAGIAGMLAGMMIAFGVIALLVRRLLRRMPLDQID